MGLLSCTFGNNNPSCRANYGEYNASIHVPTLLTSQWHGLRTHDTSGGLTISSSNYIETPRSAEVPIVIRRSILERGDLDNQRYRSASQSTENSSLFLRSNYRQSPSATHPYANNVQDNTAKIKEVQKRDRLQSISESSTQLPRKPWLDVDSPTVPDLYPKPSGGSSKPVASDRNGPLQHPISASKIDQDNGHNKFPGTNILPKLRTQLAVSSIKSFHDDETLSRDTLLSTYEAYGGKSAMRSKISTNSDRSAEPPGLTLPRSGISYRKSSSVFPESSLSAYDTDYFTGLSNISNKELDLALEQQSIRHISPIGVFEDEVRQRSGKFSNAFSKGQLQPDGDNIDLEQWSRGQTEGLSGYADEKDFTSKDHSISKHWWRKRKGWIIAGIVIPLLLIGGGLAAFFLLVKPHRSNKTTNAYVPGGFLMQPANLVGNSFAMIGTSLASLAVAGPSDTSDTSFVNFYQHSTGELRMSVFNNSQWQAPQSVTTDAHAGTPIAAYQRGNDTRMSVFYFDNNKVLQEIRSNQIGGPWTNGTIGQLVQMSDAPSDITAQFVGECQGITLGWLVFHTGMQDQARLLYWDGTSDMWTTSGAFPDVKQGAGFTSQNDDGVWRYYYTSGQTTQLEEQVCPDCCHNPRSAGWQTGLTGTQVPSVTGGMTVTNVGLSQLLYYQDANGTFRELNNTGKYPNEIWVSNTPSASVTSATGNFSKVVTNPPVGLPAAKANPNSKISSSTGISGNVQQILLFYQSNDTNINVQARDADAVGQWSNPTPIPLGG